jgi:UDP-2,3-diacylglucosamine pyrophosphatase LpxH
VFDSSIQHTKLLAKLGGKSYDMLISLNRIINNVLIAMGYEKFSLSKRVKASVKKVVTYIADFEEIAASVALEKGFDQVICGHIHQAQIRNIQIGDRSIEYLNSGDWVESLTALEYYNNSWRLYFHPDEVRKLNVVSKKSPMTEPIESKILSNAGTA